MKNWLSRLALSSCVLAGVAPTAQAGVVEIGSGREWRQVADTRGISRNELNSVCDSLTGVCNGSVGGVDFSGWTLASRGDVNQLFTSFGAPSLPLDEVSGRRSAFNAAWAALLVDPDGAGGEETGFLGRAITGADGRILGYAVDGMTRDFYEGASGEMHSVLMNVQNYFDEAALDSLGWGGAFADIGSDTRGFWLYRTEDDGGGTVPVPGTLLLVGAGLAAASLRRRTQV